MWEQASAGGGLRWHEKALETTRFPRALRLSETWLGFLNETRNPDQDHRADKCHDDSSDHASPRPQAESSKQPAANQAAEQTEDNIHDNAVATALHDLAGQPTGDQPSDNPSEKAHTNYLLGSRRSNGFDWAEKSAYSLALPQTTRKPVESSRSLAFSPTGG